MFCYAIVLPVYYHVYFHGMFCSNRAFCPIAKFYTITYKVFYYKWSIVFIYSLIMFNTVIRFSLPDRFRTDSQVFYILFLNVLVIVLPYHYTSIGKAYNQETNHTPFGHVHLVLLHLRAYDLRRVEKWIGLLDGECDISSQNNGFKLPIIKMHMYLR